MVACDMSVIIVDCLKVIHIYHKEGAVFPLGNTLINKLLRIGAVKKPRKRVPLGLALHIGNFLDFLFELIGETLS